MDAPNILDSRNASPGEAQKTFALAKWLSDWHLIAFLDTTQLLSPTDIGLLLTTASNPKLLEDQRNTLVGILLHAKYFDTDSLLEAARQSASHMADDIPQDVLDQIAAEEAAARATTGN
ncbi:hypothetical protein MPER_13595, partial [Moniliophthora perniciosa FA553]